MGNSLPPRIQLFIPQLCGGGAERQMACLANALRRKHAEMEQSSVSCALEIVTWTNPATDRYALAPGIQRVGLGITSSSGGLLKGLLANWKRVGALRKQIHRFQPQAVISFCDSMNILVLLAARKRFPVLVSERSDPRRQVLSKPWELLRQRSYPKANLCVAQTSDVAKYLQQTYFSQQPNRVVTIPSAIDAPLVDVERLSVTRQEMVEKTCVFLGRFSKEKGIDRLLRAWAVIHDQVPDWKLKLVGEGEQQSDLQTLASELGIGPASKGAVIWEPWTIDAWSHWLKANLFVLPSFYEGFPQSMLEAMTTGLAGVLTDSSQAVREVFQQGRIGDLLPRDATHLELAASLKKLMLDEHQRMECGLNAASIAKQFHWPAVEQQWFNSIVSIADDTNHA